MKKFLLILVLVCCSATIAVAQPPQKKVFSHEEYCNKQKEFITKHAKLTPEEAIVHPRRNVITRALGIEPEVLVDSDEYDLGENEYLMLCSDGLSNFISKKEMKDIFTRSKTERLAEVLVERANKNGGGDNITVVLVKKG